MIKRLNDKIVILLYRSYCLSREGERDFPLNRAFCQFLSFLGYNANGVKLRLASVFSVPLVLVVTHKSQKNLSRADAL